MRPKSFMIVGRPYRICKFTSHNTTIISLHSSSEIVEDFDVFSSTSHSLSIAHTTLVGPQLSTLSPICHQL
ncbi:hypothetical protein ABKN59_007402 [Abortiporus biennis]